MFLFAYEVYKYYKGADSVLVNNKLHKLYIYFIYTNPHLIHLVYLFFVSLSSLHSKCPKSSLHAYLQAPPVSLGNCICTRVCRPWGDLIHMVQISFSAQEFSTGTQDTVKSENMCGLLCLLYLEKWIPSIYCQRKNQEVEKNHDQQLLGSKWDADSTLPPPPLTKLPSVFCSRLSGRAWNPSDK